MKILLAGDGSRYTRKMLAYLSARAEDAEKPMAPVRKFLAGHGINAKSSDTVGQAGDEIAAWTRRGRFALVVMGPHGHGALGNLVKGSVGSRILARRTVPVLLVR